MTNLQRLAVVAWTILAIALLIPCAGIVLFVMWSMFLDVVLS